MKVLLSSDDGKNEKGGYTVYFLYYTVVGNQIKTNS